MRAQGGGSVRRARSLTPRIEATLVCPICRVAVAMEGAAFCSTDGGQISLGRVSSGARFVAHRLAASR